MMLSGVRIYESPLLVERVLHARSPARAARRAKRGFPQHYVTRPMRKVIQAADGSFIMHPEMAAELRRLVEVKLP